MSTESSLSRSVQLTHRSMMCQALSDDGHEQLGKRGCHRYAPIVVHVSGVSIALIKGCNSGVSPGLWSFLTDGFVRQEMCKGLVVLSP